MGDKNVAGPAAIGITLTAAALAAGPLTGAALNPARALGPATVFGCGGVKGAPSAAITVAVYVAAEVLGALAAALGSWPLYGGRLSALASSCASVFASLYVAAFVCVSICSTAACCPETPDNPCHAPHSLAPRRGPVLW